MQIAAGEFKAKCLKLMDEVNRTGKEITITKRGKAVARLVRANTPARRSMFGCMAGRAKILGDIVAPTGVEWEADKKIVAPTGAGRKTARGCMAGRTKILGDIIGPTGVEWEAAR